MPHRDLQFGTSGEGGVTQTGVLADLRGVFDLGSARFVRLLCGAPGTGGRLLARARPSPTSGALTVSGTVDPQTGTTTLAAGALPATPTIRGRLEIIAPLGKATGKDRDYSGPGPEFYNPAPSPDLVFSPFVSGGLVIVPERGTPLGADRSFVVPAFWEQAVQEAWRASKTRLDPIRTPNPILAGTALGLRLDESGATACEGLVQQAFAAPGDARQALFTRHLLRVFGSRAPEDGLRLLHRALEAAGTPDDLLQFAVGVAAVVLFETGERSVQALAVSSLADVARQSKRFKASPNPYLRMLLRLANG